MKILLGIRLMKDPQTIILQAYQAMKDLADITNSMEEILQIAQGIPELNLKLFIKYLYLHHGDTSVFDFLKVITPISAFQVIRVRQEITTMLVLLPSGSSIDVFKETIDFNMKNRYISKIIFFSEDNRTDIVETILKYKDQSISIYYHLLIPFTPSEILIQLRNSNWTTDYIIVTNYDNYIDDSIGTILNKRLSNKLAVIPSAENFPIQVAENMHSTLVYRYPITSFYTISGNHIPYYWNFTLFGDINRDRVFNAGLCVNVRSHETLNVPFEEESNEVLIKFDCLSP